MNPLKKVLQEQQKTEKWLADILHIKEIEIINYCTGKKELSLNALVLFSILLKVEPSELYSSIKD